MPQLLVHVLKQCAQGIEEKMVHCKAMALDKQDCWTLVNTVTAEELSSVRHHTPVSGWDSDSIISGEPLQ
jgi:hypothetical protein